MQANSILFMLTTPADAMSLQRVGSGAARLTEKILGHNSDDLVDILKELASELGLSHISFVRFASNRSWDVSLLTSIVTYSKLWQARYFLRRYG